jgi:hypothetical protein
MADDGSGHATDHGAEARAVPLLLDQPHRHHHAAVGALLRRRRRLDGFFRLAARQNASDRRNTDAREYDDARRRETARTLHAAV